jgi:hypothetical protein
MKVCILQTFMIIALCQCQSIKSSSTPKIIHGKLLENKPYLVRLLPSMCSASLISKRVAVTAAHCVANKGIDSIKIMSHEGTLVQGQEILVNPLFTRYLEQPNGKLQSSAEDVAFILLRSPLKPEGFSALTTRVPYFSSTFTVAGFGGQDAQKPFDGMDYHGLEAEVRYGSGDGLNEFPAVSGKRMREVAETYRRYGLLAWIGDRKGGGDAPKKYNPSIDNGDSGGVLIQGEFQIGVLSSSILTKSDVISFSATFDQPGNRALIFKLLNTSHWPVEVVCCKCSIKNSMKNKYWFGSSEEEGSRFDFLVGESAEDSCGKLVDSNSYQITHDVDGEKVRDSRSFYRYKSCEIAFEKDRCNTKPNAHF